MNNLIKAAKDVLKRYDRDDGVINLHSDGDLVEALRQTLADNDYETLKQERDKYRNVVESVLKDFGSDDDGCTANRILNAINEALK